MVRDTPPPPESPRQKIHKSFDEFLDAIDPTPQMSKNVLHHHLNHIETNATGARMQDPRSPRTKVILTFNMLEATYADRTADLEQIKILRKAVDDYMDGK